MLELGPDGQKTSMSTRSGEFVTLRELRKEVGNDACRFFYMLRKSDQALDFDLDELCLECASMFTNMACGLDDGPLGDVRNGGLPDFTRLNTRRVDARDCYQAFDAAGKGFNHAEHETADGRAGEVADAAEHRRREGL